MLFTQLSLRDHFKKTSLVVRISRLDEAERGCCCEGCDSMCDAYKDAGWLKRIYLTILFIFCGCYLFISCITIEPCLDKGICDRASEKGRSGHKLHLIIKQ